MLDMDLLLVVRWSVWMVVDGLWVSAGLPA